MGIIILLHFYHHYQQYIYCNFFVVCLDDLASVNIQNHKWIQKNIITLGSKANSISQFLKKGSVYQIKITIKIYSLYVKNTTVVSLQTI